MLASHGVTDTDAAARVPGREAQSSGTRLLLPAQPTASDSGAAQAALTTKPDTTTRDRRSPLAHAALQKSSSASLSSATLRRSSRCWIISRAQVRTASGSVERRRHLVSCSIWPAICCDSGPHHIPLTNCAKRLPSIFSSSPNLERRNRAMAVGSSPPGEAIEGQAELVLYLSRPTPR
jgi:hypothetical protein